LARDVAALAAALGRLHQKLGSAFGGADPVRGIADRRLNRYLIWHWIRIGLKRVDDLDAMTRLLGSKPALEISGPQVRVLDVAPLVEKAEFHVIEARLIEIEDHLS
jgi:hypothetical protein